MKIGLIRETKIPVDNRVALTPTQAKNLKEKYPNLEIVAQSSPIRAFSDDEYRQEGIEIVDDVRDCDLLLGIKEAAIDTLIPDKHYIFFGHIAKKQAYNKPLFKTLLDKEITFSDYEYLTDDNGQRLVAFGWYAGIVGLYYTLQGWGFRTKKYSLPKPHLHFSIEEIIENLKNVDLNGLKIVITGSGRVSHGAQHVLHAIGAKELDPNKFITAEDNSALLYTVLPVDRLVAENTGKQFDFGDFVNNPNNYHETFTEYAKAADILLCCHFWGDGQPVYLDADSFRKPDFRIRMIGDITCDIMGSIKSTLRSSTHDTPFYDYNPLTEKEEEPFSSEKNVTVMAVDTCPNALPRVTSEHFGNKLTEHVLTECIEKDCLESVILDRATIVKEGELNTPFNYLEEYVKTL